ncbi:hypothetical protein HanRHA438_Chr01g0033181 [Helianthus annuus]|nr:hypothetical protein HanRHA438_Chr01g0033181 [Helianthus annuus]
MAVILVAGLKAATCVLTHVAANDGDSPISETSSFVTLIITSIPVSDSAVSKRALVSKRRTCVM